MFQATVSECNVERGGSEGLGIHRTYPYPAYGGLAPVPGGQGEQRDDIADPSSHSGKAVYRIAIGGGKGLIHVWPIEELGYMYKVYEPIYRRQKSAHPLLWSWHANMHFLGERRQRPGTFSRAHGIGCGAVCEPVSILHRPRYITRSIR